MTRSQIADRIVRNLDDAGLVHFTAVDATDSIQDGYDLLALLSCCIEKITTINFVANKVFYDLSATISDYYRIFAIYNQKTKRWMEPLHWREFQNFGLNWEINSGEAQAWTPLGYSTIAITRAPTVSTSSMLVMYCAQASVLASSDSPDFPPDLHDTLVEYGTGDLMDQDLEFSKSILYMNRFNEKALRIKGFMNKRSLPDRIYSLMAQWNEASISK